MLHEDKKLFQAVLESVSAELNINQTILEKD